MADIALYEDDSEDTTESDTGLGLEDYDSDPSDPDAGLSMLQRLEKYCHDENMFTRQMVTRSLLETIRTIENEDETRILLDSIVTLADDPEAMVRSELMEHIPHVAIYCLENLHIFGDPIPTHLLPIVVKYITDTNNQVRKTSQAALLVLLEQEMIKRDDVVDQVCPVILELSHPESVEDFRIEAVALMSKLAPLVGKEATEQIFLSRFAEMCTDPLFCVRKVCATNFGDFCSVVGEESTESVLLHKFFYLCEDGVWGVRKACAECFMQVSCVCSLEIRRSELAQLFVNLICDQSRWVRMAAFQALGGFISTFADPSNTGLYFSDEGVLMVGNPETFQKISRENSTGSLDNEAESCDSKSDTATERGSSDNVTPSESESSGTSSTDDSEESPSDSVFEPLPVAMDTSEDSSVDLESASEAIQQMHLDVSVEEQRAKHVEEENIDSESRVKCQTPDSTKSLELNSTGATDDSLSSELRKSSDNGSVSTSGAQSVTEDSESSGNSKNKVHIHLANNSTAFSTFQFWRMPLPEIDVDVDIVDGKAANIHVQTKVKDIDTSTALVSKFDVVVSDKEAASSTETTQVQDLAPAADAMEVDIESNPTSGASQSENTNGEDTTKIHTASVSTVCETVEEVANIGSTHILGHHVNESTMTIKDGVVQDERSRHPTSTSEEQESFDGTDLQDVIPQALLDHYLSMTDPSRAQTVDSEIAKHCAYSLPAVAYTLGRKYWPCLRELYENLAGDMQWKVRRTLAFSIHELAVIVGEDVTSRDLVPIFNGFLKDLDEVRIGVLKHLGDFLKLLNPDMRQEYLTKLCEFLNTDNTRNWRFREELAIQLRSLLDLYSPGDISDHLVPIAFLLAEDSVAAVRTCAFSVLSAIVGRLVTCGDNKKFSSLVQKMTERFTESPKWANRQMFVHICGNILEENTVPQDMFASELLPILLSLSNDPIPNVRISLSRTLSRFLLMSDYFTSGQNPYHSDLLEVVHKLKCDGDRDVRHFLQPMNEHTEISNDTIPV